MWRPSVNPSRWPLTCSSIRQDAAEVAPFPGRIDVIIGASCSAILRPGRAIVEVVTRFPRIFGREPACCRGWAYFAGPGKCSRYCGSVGDGILHAVFRIQPKSGAVWKLELSETERFAPRRATCMPTDCARARSIMKAWGYIKACERAHPRRRGVPEFVGESFPDEVIFRAGSWTRSDSLSMRYGV